MGFRDNVIVAVTLLGCATLALAADAVGWPLQMQSMPVRLTVPVGWQAIPADQPSQTASATFERLQLRLKRGSQESGRGMMIMAVAATVAEAPSVILKRAEQMAVLIAPDLCSKASFIKREPATLWGRPAVKLAIRCTPEDKLGSITNVVFWIATDGRRTLLVQAAAEPADWPMTWQAFLNVTDSVVWKDESR